MSTNSTFVTPTNMMMKRFCASSTTKKIADISEVNSGLSESQPEILTKQTFERLLIEVDCPTDVRVKLVPAFQESASEESASEESASEESASEESSSVVTPRLSSPTTVIHVCDDGETIFFKVNIEQMSKEEAMKRVQSQAGASPDFVPIEVMLLNQPQETVSTVQEVSPPDHHAQSNFLLDDTEEHGYSFLQMKMMVDHVLSTVNCLGFNCSPRCE